MYRPIILTMAPILTKLLCVLIICFTRCMKKSTQTIEGMWMQAKRKLSYQSETSHGLFPNDLSAFQWRKSHKFHVFGQYLGLFSDNAIGVY